jgi:hypothetical protein
LEDNQVKDEIDHLKEVLRRKLVWDGQIKQSTGESPNNKSEFKDRMTGNEETQGKESENITECINFIFKILVVPPKPKVKKTKNDSTSCIHQ